MATLLFDGSNDYIGGTDPGALTGAYTLAAIFKRPTAAATADAILAPYGATSCFEWFMDSDKGNVYNDNDGNITPWTWTPATSTDLTTNDIFLVALTRGSGETPRHHVKNLTDDLAWHHENGANTQTTNPDANTAIDIGRFNLIGIGQFDFFEGAIGLVGWWDGVEMSDGQVEALATGLQTSAWHGHAAGTPTSLTELTSASPVDLEGTVTWTNNGATLAGDDMALWDFDGTGGAAPGPTAFLKWGGSLVPSTVQTKFDGVLYPGL